MRCLVRFLTRRASGGIGYRDVPVDATSLRLGRGTDNEVFLPDIRVSYRQARIHIRAGAVVIEGEGVNTVRVNGASMRQASIGVEDDVDVGPYRIKLLPATPEAELAISVELVVPLGDDVERMRQASGIGLLGTLPSKRALSWSLALVVLGLFLVLPVAAFMADPIRKLANTVLPFAVDKPWESGPLSAPHKFFGNNCTTCHEKAFVMVRDEACVTCHKTIAHHADPSQVTLAGLTDTRCASCHKEHNGVQAPVIEDQRLCVDCHGGLTAKAKGTALGNVSDFGTNHPEFRPNVVADPVARKAVRVALNAAPAPKERSNLVYPHDKHLKPEGVRGPAGLVKLDCGSCHVPEQGGGLMRPIAMEKHCAACHTLNFEAKAPDRVLPHGKPKEVIAVVKDFYAALALRGGGDEPDMPGSVRRRPGTPLTSQERVEALQWAEMRGENQLRAIFGKSICATCHLVKSPAESASKNWEITPVWVASRWMPKSVFSHRKHEVFGCDDCHKASKSASAEDVLMPDLASCRTCHGGERASAAVPSPCTMCHVFHQPGLAPMRPAKTVAK